MNNSDLQLRVQRLEATLATVQRHLAMDHQMLESLMHLLIQKEAFDEYELCYMLSMVQQDNTVQSLEHLYNHEGTTV